MMRRVWKYRLEITDEQVLSVPAGAAFLAVQFQGNDLVVWALVHPDAPRELRRFAVVGTGNPCERQWVYLGTAQDLARPLVWHVFYEPSREGVEMIEREDRKASG